MDSLPDLDRLSVTEKDELIRALIARVQTLTAEMAALTAKVVELEGRLAQNSRNSSQPPSSDGDGKPKPKSLRKAGQNPTGGQKGHPGHTLKKTDSPDPLVIQALPAPCEVCGSPVMKGTVAQSRQVFDLPPTHYEVTEHPVLMRLGCL
jgi:transposase